MAANAIIRMMAANMRMYEYVFNGDGSIRRE